MLRCLIVAGVVLAGVATAAAQEAQSQPPSQVSSQSQALSLEDALKAAERASESIAVARANVERAESQVTSARAGYLPLVNGTAAYQRTLRTEFDDINFTPPGMTGEEVDLPFGQRNNWRAGVSVNQPLFDGFRTRAAIDQAKAGVRISELGVATSRTQIVLQVAVAYYGALLAERQVEIGEVTLQQAQATLDTTQLNFKQGTAPEFDLVRAQVARDNQSTALVQFRVRRDVALVQLRRLVGLRVDQPVTLSTKLEADDLDNVIAVARSAAGMPSQTRIAVAQAREAIALREAAVSLAKGAYYPTVAAGTDLGFVNYENQPFNGDWKTNWTLGVNLSIPIFDGFRRRAQVRGSRADLASARAELANASEVSQVESAQAAANVAASATTLEQSTRTVGQAQRAYQIAELRFQQGASTHLELVDARVQLQQALLNQARSSHDLKIAKLNQELLPGLPIGSLRAGGF